MLDVEVVDQSTGDFNISGGYSTTDGALVEVKVGERNFYGTGKTVQAAFTYGQYARGIDLAASEPYFLGTKVAAGIELFGRQTDASSYQSYGSDTYGATLQLGTPITEQLGVQWRYSIYNQNVTLAPNSSRPDAVAADPAGGGRRPAWVSAVGSTVTYNTLDNTKSPTSGIKSQLSQDLAGLGGDVKFLRTTEDVRYYKSINSDVVGMVRAQGGYVTGWGGQQVPLMNSFFGGPTMVRGFAPNGFGPRDLTPGTTMDNVGGSMYWATTAELQSAIPGVPQEYGLKATAFVDAGSVFRYSGSTAIAAGRQHERRALFGRRRPDLGLAVRRADRRLRRAADQGRLRRGAAASVQRGRILTGIGCGRREARRSAPAGRGIRGIAARNNRSSAGCAIRAAARPAPWSCPGPGHHAPAPSRRRRVRARRDSAAALPCAGPR